ncbi:hypothetical protein [Tropicimonas sp. IMCC6043]|uniref:hypothetical protein n=1 Tax=Tropicimonas sp. IMCC6043 TaxID=2510645 RepID=UPI00101BC57E|nr:hypothetical protein [Tropicimonas sp. IMCC6043]RYH10347.1 hypothetical protein EU800_08635 [Tropicimonas sp. IMCC6043]
MHFRAAMGVIALSFVFALVYRVFPLFSGPDAISEFFVTEDGYLMLTVSRNFAIGNGLSVSDGLIATNGVQPLATFLYSIPFVLSAGVKLAALKGFLAIMTAVSVVAALVIGGYARHVLRH